MTRLVWDQADNRYEAGVDRGVFYPLSGPGEVWNGLTSVQESPSDADERRRYIDGRPVRSRRRPGDFAGRIEAFTYPQSFHDHALIPRKRRNFGLSYRVMTGETTYKTHLVYNILLGSTSPVYDQEEHAPFSWDFTTTPVVIPGMKPCAHIIIDSSIAYPQTIAAFEEMIYGSDAAEARLPSPLEVLDIFEENSILRVIDHGDGSWTAIGPDDAISVFADGSFEINYPSAVWVSDDTYTIQSL